MRQVEVAASEELDGPTSAELDAIRAATFTVEAINEREKVTDHDTAAFVDVLAESAGPGSTPTRCAPGARMGSTPSRPRSGSSSPGSPSKPSATCAGSSGRLSRRR